MNCSLFEHSLKCLKGMNFYADSLQNSMILFAPFREWLASPHEFVIVLSIAAIAVEVFPISF